MIDLGDLTLLPGPHGHGGQPPAWAGPTTPARSSRCRTTPRCETLRGGRQRPPHAARRVHDRAQPRAVRADRRARCSTSPSRRRSTSAGSTGPRIVPAGHAITPTGGHLDPTMFQALAPHVLPLTVEEGIANGVDEVRKAVRYQIKHGAQVIKVCASGGVMSHTGPAGAQQYSDEELRGHRRRGPPRRPQGRRPRPRRRRHPRRHRGRASTASSTARS